ncbi:MAG: alpha/beta hydrolase [Acidimicrobiales bacterium]|nr:alpha/beta hydrolase [Hyphomonadaceae bacterium]RZV35406.1 MAG: alpha/beta hydrolase [Acidimicrobiales bacterium]
MVSIRAALVNRLLFLTGVKTFLSNPDKVDDNIVKLRRKGPDLPRARYRKIFNVTETEQDGIRVFTVAPRDPDQNIKKHVLYLHGGGYLMPIAWAHWNFIGRLVMATGRSVTVPLYPLAPEHIFSETLPAMQTVFHRIAEKYGTENIAVMGDSAGGGMTLALTHKLRDEDQIQPEKLVLLSPWLDATGTHPDQPGIEPKDTMLAVSGLKMAGKMYAGDAPSNDIRVSPLFANHADLPPVQVLIGTHDILLPDSQRFRDQMSKLGTPVDYREYSGMYHVWMLMAVPEGKQAMSEIAAFLAPA